LWYRIRMQGDEYAPDRLRVLGRGYVR